MPLGQKRCVLDLWLLYKTLTGNSMLEVELTGQRVVVWPLDTRNGQNFFDIMSYCATLTDKDLLRRQNFVNQARHSRGH